MLAAQNSANFDAERAVMCYILFPFAKHLVMLVYRF